MPGGKWGEILGRGDKWNQFQELGMCLLSGNPRVVPKAEGFAFEGDDKSKTRKWSLVCEGLRTAVVGSRASESF